jgi:dihydropyrimidinase
MIGKGGSGKTTTASNLGAALAEMGNRVCLIDIDPQGGLTRSLGINPKDLPKEQTMYWPLIGEVPLADILVQPENSAVHLAPSNLHLVGCDRDLPEDGQTLREAVAAYRAKAEGNCLTDVSFHLIVKETDPVTLGQDLPALIQAGYTSFKVFMTYAGLALSDRQILDVMAVAKEQNAMVMVHAENEDAIEFLRDKAERAGETGPYHHATTRPVPAEREATHRAISLAEIAGVPLTIVHVSNGEATEEIIRARARGLTVFAETCPQYITLTASDLDRGGFEGAKYVCSPPPRTSEEWPKLWAGIEQGAFDLFSSDHCPFRFESDAGKDAPGARKTFRNIPNGIPGVETRLPILFSEGVSKGRMSLERFAALTATNHARLYGLFPRKGAIMGGADADIALWDPTLTKPIRQADLHHGTDYTPWEGFEVTGWPVRTILRGVTTMLDGGPVGAPVGTHLPRGTPDVLL